MKTDPSYLDAALRETHEELGIGAQNIEILGQIGPPEVNLRGNMVVHPFVVRSLSITRAFHATESMSLPRVLCTLVHHASIIIWQT